MNRITLFLLTLIFCSSVNGQNKPFVTHPDQLNDGQYASWISPPPGSGYGVFYFRKKVDLESIPESFFVHASADIRYNLYVNGTEVSWGPAVDDLMNWNYETVDISRYLIPGRNIISAKVWDPGPQRGSRQISNTTAFILQGDQKKESIINTDKTWLVYKDPGYFCTRMTRDVVGGGYIAGGTDSLISKLHPWGWKKLLFNDSDWHHASEIGKGNHSGLDDWKGTQWQLRAREIPPMQQKKETISSLVSVGGMEYPVSKYNGSIDIKIPPMTSVEILLDHKVLTMGFPHLQVQGGKDSKINIQYQEALFNPGGGKGNRDELEGKIMKGYYDVYIADGEERMFIPQWLRVFRYVKLSIETKDEALYLKDFYNLYTAYPFKQVASFNSDHPMLKDIWDVSWRTVRLCGLETYMDCPYYEQKQYVGDTRIQALISMYIAGDDRLVKTALRQFYNSMQPMGLFKSNHPADEIQIIPPFTLLYIAMVHDYFMLRDDPAYVKQFIPGIRFSLEWFVDRIAENGIMGPIPYWNHIDGGAKFRNGSPPGVSDGGSAHMTILLAYAIDKAINMFRYFGYDYDAARLEKISTSLKENVLRLCYDKERQLIAETPDQSQFSQHTNTFAILTDMFDGEMEKSVAQKVINDKSLIQTTLYFDYYVFQAMKKAGMGGEIIDYMRKWEEFLDYGLTTFPEHGINSRSDCHAWSSHPMIDFLNITCGITSSSRGFETVLIHPQPGELEKFQGSAYHPRGFISVSLDTNKKGRKTYKVILPEGLTGKFVMDDQSFDLMGGEREFVFK